MKYKHLPEKQGLYDPRFEHDACGVGFVCDIAGKKSHAIVSKGIRVLNRLSHRGAVGADPKTGDGAGILIQLPHKFLLKVCSKEGIDLPKAGKYGTGLIFLPKLKKEREVCINIFESVIKEVGQSLLGWREVSLDNSMIGKTAREAEPSIKQIFIGQGDVSGSELSFERKLYVIRKLVENRIRRLNLKQKKQFYINSLSSRTFIYKGLVMPHQLEGYFDDLRDENLESSICLVHSRYSTNTFPTWDLAQPFRYLAHNGEINTLKGNINWMRAREGLLSSDLFGPDLDKIKPIIIPDGSDSATIDNVFEFLVLSGRPLAHVMMMLIPGAWQNNNLMDKKLKSFYKYHSCFMEPWDGPAAIAFTDGTSIGAALDRNGLRPARYIVTKKGLVVMASEVGVLDIKPDEIKVSGRLEPGKLLYIDTDRKRMIDDEELKNEISGKRPYGAWVKKKMRDIDDIDITKYRKKVIKDLNRSFRAFNYTREDMKFIVGPMAENGKEPVGSMGNDAPHAVLSKNTHLVYNYFKQLFAQVTNPAIDSIREELVMSLESCIGREMNILDETPAHAAKLRVTRPILTNLDLQKIESLNEKGFRSKVISIVFPSNDLDLSSRLDRICLIAEEAIHEGYSFLVLTDRGHDRLNAAIPALIATGALHQYLVRKGLRTRTAIIVESAEPREVHHFALLFGYGADCVNPYLAFEAVRLLIQEGSLKVKEKEALKNYRKAVDKGILKILSKMGISTLQSYRGAQIFEAFGIRDDVIEKCFTGTASRIGGAGMDILVKEVLINHNTAYAQGPAQDQVLLPTGGLYQWRKDGEFHLWNPETITALQDASRNGDYEKYKEFSKMINDQSEQPATLRSLFKLTSKKGQRKPIDITEVEPEDKIFKRFATGAMSFGSISRYAHETLAIAMNRIGASSNTGEGGEDPMRFVSLPSGDYKRSAIKQIASGRFGVIANYLVNADEIQIKIAQGAKPGEGGQLPGHKVSEIIARTRYTTPGVTLISPPPHHDIYSIEDLAQLIFDLKNVNPYARISVKLVSETGVGTVAAGVAKGHADMILISGGDGGTGASPLSSIKHAGLPWELGISETHQTLVLNDLRSRVRLQTDGQMRTGRDIAIAALLGAEEYGFSTAALIVMGCIMLRHCHLNNCSVGVATQDEILQRRFTGKAGHVVNYFTFVVRELRGIMAQLGFRTIDEMIGKTEYLDVDENKVPWKAKDIDYTRILYKPKVEKGVGVYKKIGQDHGIDKVLDRKLIKLSKPALERGQSVSFSMDINNTNRTTGAMLSGEVCRQYGESALADGTIKVKFKGVAGQSFGAWLVKGVEFELEGMANDYIGKGISGGRIIVYPGKKADYKPEENIIIGNTTFYGAIRGEAYIRGRAGERFCIRNSGLLAVCEGVGDHGCEYMTGGRVVVLGPTGRNFAAGMSGGIAYIYDEEGNFSKKCNMEMVVLENLGPEDRKVVRRLVKNHQKYTNSVKAKRLFNNFAKGIKKFIKVMPIEYKHILEGTKIEENLDLLEPSDT